MPRAPRTPDASKTPVSLEDQLSLVVEQEGMSLSSPDGVRLMRAPNQVDVKRSSRRRRGKKIGYADRPAISANLSEDRTRDTVADLDRIVVGFAEVHAPRMVRKPVAIRQSEHERSPYVVSLRGLSLIPVAVEAEERIPASALLDRALPPTEGGIPNLEAVAALASDLCPDEDDTACQEQFTAANFQTTYTGSYGLLNQLMLATSAFFSAIARVFSWSPAAPSAEAGAPAEEGGGTSVAVSVTRFRFGRIALGMAGLLLAATLPANAVRFARSLESDKAAALIAGHAGVAEAKAAANTPLPESVEALRRASARFRQADDVLDSTNALAVGLAGLVPQTRSAYRTARSLAEIGAKTSDAGALLANGLSTALGANAKSPLDRLGVMSAYAEGALPLLDDAAEAFRHVDPKMIPQEEQAKVVQLQEGIEQGRTAIREFTGLSVLLSEALGRSGPRRYLVVFQNPSELRPTGGFMGSFAEVTIDQGEITKLHVPTGGTYAVQGQLTARITPPAPLGLIAERWEFQDSNWSPDFSAAVQKIRSFWSKAGGPTVDGVIAVNATFVEKLLLLTGPIEVPELGKTITSENFLLETQKSVELEYDRVENQPKKILGLLAPRLMERLKALPQEQLVGAFGLLSSALESKEIQASFLDPDEDALARRYGWSGQLKSTPGDTFAMITANIAGQKTDLAINENVDHVATIAANGSIEDTVSITRTHTASKGELFRGVRNVAYIRFYVPRGSTLLSAKGFKAPDASLFSAPEEGLETDPDEAKIAHTRTRHASGLDVWDEGERTVFGGWSMVDPGQTQSLALHYRLPFTAQDLRSRLNMAPSDSGESSNRSAYTLLLTSQSGTPHRQITSHIAAPTDWTLAWGRAAEGIEAIWDHDYVMAALYETK